MADFVGKRIVITGGAGGIGVETARAFMDLGGHVIIVDIDDDDVAAEVHESARGFHADTTCSASDHDAFADEVRHGSFSALLRSGRAPSRSLARIIVRSTVLRPARVSPERSH